MSIPTSTQPAGPLTLAEKVWNDHLVAKGEDGSNLLQSSRDVFTTACAKLDLVFTPRS